MIPCTPAYFCPAGKTHLVKWYRLFSVLKKWPDLALLPGYLSGNFLLDELGPAEVLVIRQVQDVGLVLF